MDERGGLENRCGPLGHRGFESHPLRLNAKTKVTDLRLLGGEISGTISASLSLYAASARVVAIIRSEVPSHLRTSLEKRTLESPVRTSAYASTKIHPKEPDTIIL